MRIRSVGREQFNDQLDHHPWGVELAALLAGIVGKLLDQVFVGPAEEVGLGHVVVAERDLREVLNEAGEHGVPALGIAELPFVVVIDAGEDAFQAAVLLLQRRAGLVQRLPDVRCLLLDRAPPRPVGHEEPVFVQVGPRHCLRDAVRNELFRLLLEPVRQPLQEQQAEDVGLVVTTVDRPAQNVGGRPEISLQLGDTQQLRRRLRLAHRGARIGGWHRTAAPLCCLRWPHETCDQIGLLAPGIIEIERPTQLLQPVPGEVEKNLSDAGLTRPGYRIDEAGLDPTIPNLQSATIDHFTQLAASQLSEDCARRRHLRVTAVWRADSPALHSQRSQSSGRTPQWPNRSRSYLREYRNGSLPAGVGKRQYTTGQ